MPQRPAAPRQQARQPVLRPLAARPQPPAPSPRPHQIRHKHQQPRSTSSSAYSGPLALHLCPTEAFKAPITALINRAPKNTAMRKQQRVGIHPKSPSQMAEPARPISADMGMTRTATPTRVAVSFSSSTVANRVTSNRRNVPRQGFRAPQATGRHLVINGTKVSSIEAHIRNPRPEKTGDPQIVGPVGLEPTTYGLKVRSSTN